MAEVEKFKKIILFSYSATYANGATIKFENNQLTAFSEDIFKPILDSFIASSQSGNRITVNQSETISILFFEFCLLVQ